MTPRVPLLCLGLGLLLASPAAAATAGFATFGDNDTRVQGAVFASGTSGRVMMAADGPLPKEEISFNFASAACGSPPGTLTPLLTGGPPPSALDAGFTLADDLINEVRSLRVLGDGRQVLCARSTRLSRARARRRPRVLAGQAERRANDGPDVLYFFRVGVNRVSYYAIFSPRDAASGLPTARAATFDNIKWILSRPKGGSCQITANDDWESPVAVKSFRGSAGCHGAHRMTRLKVTSTEGTLATGRLGRYVSG